MEENTPVMRILTKVTKDVSDIPTMGYLENTRHKYTMLNVGKKQTNSESLVDSEWFHKRLSSVLHFRLSLYGTH